MESSTNHLVPPKAAKTAITEDPFFVPTLEQPKVVANIRQTADLVDSLIASLTALDGGHIALK